MRANASAPMPDKLVAFSMRLEMKQRSSETEKHWKIARFVQDKFRKEVPP